MSLDRDNVLASFRNAEILLNRRPAGGLWTASVANGTVRIELTPEETDITAVKVYFTEVDDEGYSPLITAFWQAVLPNTLWKAKVDECMESARRRDAFEGIIDGIEIKLHYDDTVAVIEARQTTNRP